MPCRKLRHREEPRPKPDDIHDATQRHQRIARIQRPIPLVEVRQVPWRVPRRRHHPQRPIQLTIAQQMSRPRHRSRKSTLHRTLRLAWIERPVLRRLLRQQPRLTSANRHLRLSECTRQRIQRPDVVHMRMRQQQPRNRLACNRARRIDHPLRPTRYPRIDQREAIALANKIAIDQSKSSELMTISGDRMNLHICS